MTIEYERISSRSFASPTLLEQCSCLYSAHYGRWSEAEPDHAGKNIFVSSERLKEWLSYKYAEICVARDGAFVIGYAIARRLKVPNYGIISWVVQLVVHEEYRQQDIATNLLYSIWGFSDDFACGMISASPYAIRTLEKATRRRCLPQRIKSSSKKLLSLGREFFLIDETTKKQINQDASKINTSFCVDHSALNTMITDVVTKEVPWMLGSLEEGWEWFAFTFQDQEQIDLPTEEVKTILAISDRMVHEARRLWGRHPIDRCRSNAAKEVKFIRQECRLSKDDLVYDFGCERGGYRAAELAQSHIRVKAINCVNKPFEFRGPFFGVDAAFANSNVRRYVKYLFDDCRTIRFDEKAKAIICLCGAVGLYVDDNENKRILHNLYDNLASGGTLILAVLNYERIEYHAKHRFSLDENPGEVFKIKSRDVKLMPDDISDSDSYAVDIKTNVVYRKERSSRYEWPIDLIVRDRRFTGTEIESLCEDAGFTIEHSRYVNRDDWDICLSPTDMKATEILLKCRKS
jgi:hypothetical protein